MNAPNYVPPLLPEDIPSGKIPNWNGNAWVYVDPPVQEDPLANLTLEDIVANLLRYARQSREYGLDTTDFLFMSDYSIDAGILNLWKSYRQELRDVTKQPDYPTKIEWPVFPVPGFKAEHPSEILAGTKLVTVEKSGSTITTTAIKPTK